MSFVINVRFKFFAWAIKSLSKGSLWINGRDLISSKSYSVTGHSKKDSFLQ